MKEQFSGRGELRCVARVLVANQEVDDKIRWMSAGFRDLEHWLRPRGAGKRCPGEYL
jgi:hypothetical protein